jgi:hypothetical protein
MTELELYKLIEKYASSHHWNNEGTDVIVLVNNCDIEEFVEKLPKFENGLKITLMDGYIAFEMSEICDKCDIEMTNVFPKEEE